MAGKRNGKPDLFVRVWRVVNVPARVRQGGTVVEVLKTEPLAQFFPWTPRWTLPAGFYASKRTAAAAAARETPEAVTPCRDTPLPPPPVPPAPVERTGAGATGWGKAVAGALRQRANDYRAELADAKRRARRHRLADVSGMTIGEAVAAQLAAESDDA